ncbi:MAG: hypothetical protein QM736_14645 [Vicinamibacterales bacterium]
MLQLCAMAKVKALKAPRSVHRCEACGHVEAKWLGRCPACQEWNSLVEEIDVAPVTCVRALRVSLTGGAPVSIVDVGEVFGDVAGSTRHRRARSRARRRPRARAAAVLLGGDPGIGKSHAARCRRSPDSRARAARARVLYATGEESVAQTAHARASRRRCAPTRCRSSPRPTSSVILAHAERTPPAVLAVDSIQTIYTRDARLDSRLARAGSRVRGAADALREDHGHADDCSSATSPRTAAIAGPKTLEHLVDVVLQLEGDGGPVPHPARAQESLRLDAGDRRVRDARRRAWPRCPIRRRTCSPSVRVGAPGSVVVASADGARPLLVEIQALVAPAAAGFGRRTAAGVDANRVSLLLAVLAQRAACDVLDRDVFVNVAGGLQLAEPAIDLGVACAIASSRARPRDRSAHRRVRRGRPRRRDPRGADVRAASRRSCAARVHAAALVPAQNVKQLEERFGLDIVPIIGS